MQIYFMTYNTPVIDLILKYIALWANIFQYSVNNLLVPPSEYILTLPHQADTNSTMPSGEYLLSPKQTLTLQCTLVSIYSLPSRH